MPGQDALGTDAGGKPKPAADPEPTTRSAARTLVTRAHARMCAHSPTLGGGWSTRHPRVSVTRKSLHVSHSDVPFFSLFAARPAGQSGRSAGLSVRAAAILSRAAHCGGRDPNEPRLTRRDIDRFDQRARSYERGQLGAWHQLVAERTALLAAAAEPTARRVLDVGCGTGMLTRALAGRLSAAELVGVDPAERMLAVARASTPDDTRLRFERATAERLPFRDESFELVASAVSFDHWSDQLAGLVECRRVLDRGGAFVVADLFAAWLSPTTIRHRRRARTPGRAEGLLEEAGFNSIRWERIFDLGPFPLVQAAVAAPRPNVS